MIDAETIEAIASELARIGLSSQSMATLRASYPKIHLPTAWTMTWVPRNLTPVGPVLIFIWLTGANTA